MIRVLIAEDQAMVRGALASLLSLEDDIEVIAEVDRGDLVVEAARRNAADVALLDIEMPGLDGISAAAELTRRLPAVRSLILTTFGRPGYLRRALDAGAAGFLLKDAPADRLAAAIRDVAQGRHAIDPDLAAQALSEGESPADATRAGGARRCQRLLDRRRDRRNRPPVRGDGAQLPQRRDPEAGRPQPPRRNRPGDREGMAVRTTSATRLAKQTSRSARLAGRF